MALEALDRDIFSHTTSPAASARRPFNNYTTTLAMHWDGTYRDRRTARRGLRGFISADEWPRDPVIDLAKHLASDPS